MRHAKGGLVHERIEATGLRLRACELVAAHLVWGDTLRDAHELASEDIERMGYCPKLRRSELAVIERVFAEFERMEAEKAEREMQAVRRRAERGRKGPTRSSKGGIPLKPVKRVLMPGKERPARVPRSSSA